MNMQKSKKKFSMVAIACLLVLSFTLGTCKYAGAESKNWSVYYATGGGNGESKIISLPVYGGNYRAKCETFSGNCTYQAVTILCYKTHTNTELRDKINLSTSVKFSTTGKKDFSLSYIPSVPNVHFSVFLDHSGGNSVSASGFIKTL